MKQCLRACSFLLVRFLSYRVYRIVIIELIRGSKTCTLQISFSEMLERLLDSTLFDQKHCPSAK